MTADFMTDFLVARSKLADFDEFKEFIPSPGEGTLKIECCILKII